MYIGILKCDTASNKTQEEFEIYKNKLANIDFIEDPTLVRGLDYYNGITFEPPQGSPKGCAPYPGSPARDH